MSYISNDDKSFQHPFNVIIGLTKEPSRTSSSVEHGKLIELIWFFGCVFVMTINCLEIGFEKSTTVVPRLSTECCSIFTVRFFYRSRPQHTQKKQQINAQWKKNDANSEWQKEELYSIWCEVFSYGWFHNSKRIEVNIRNEPKIVHISITHAIHSKHNIWPQPGGAMFSVLECNCWMHAFAGRIKSNSFGGLYTAFPFYCC